MKRILAAISLSFLGLATPASAIVGGPFDNGSHSSAIEGNGYYQAIFTLRNGSGHATFSEEARIALIQSTDVSTRASIVNRSVFYYKGITYVGGAFGMVDHGANYIQGEVNGSSDVSNSVVQQSQQAGFFTFSSTTTSVSSAVTSSARSFTVNGNFEARIIDTAPILKFRGKGELSFLSPSGADSIAGLAFQGYSGLISAINQALTNDIDIDTGNEFTNAQLAIDNALLALPKHLVNAGIDNAYEQAVIAKTKVRGTRRYFSTAPTQSAF